MGQILETLAVKLVLDAAEFADGISKSESKFAAFGQKMTSMGKGLTLGVTTPILGIAAASVGAASDLGESMNKVDVVFGEASDSVIAWSENASAAFGQSQQQALEAAGTFGNLFDALGMSSEATETMSIGLVELASDLASFNNIDPTEALEKLRAGIVGETEPLRTLGVNLTAATVEAKALEMGLAATAKELTESDKVTARYAIILAQTKNAQGDFARTSDGVANATRIAKAQFIDATAALGQNLLPMVTQGVAILNNMLERFKNLDPATQAWIVKIALLVAAIGPVLVAIGSMISAATAVAGAITALGPVMAGAAAAIAALGGPITIAIAAIAALALAWSQNWGDIRGKAEWAWEGIKGFVGSGIDFIKGAFSIDWGQLGRGLIDGIVNGIRAGWNAVTEAASNIATGALDAAKRALGIASPSREGLAIGVNFGESIGAGANRALRGISADVAGQLNSMTGGLRGQVSMAGVGGVSIVLNQTFSGNVDRSAVESGTRRGVLAGLREVGLA